ncbi:helix-turn-helix domain-containing protein [Aliarcobacter cryaerophilus]|uniref:helix-turn-helix domain-containing protein n=1 Tax=Aliarcobacter cryaerophilus TaxID=28198 RepID=UPI0021B441B3|nr:helix-turn-helix transcriptional regulator [Aliarcobacter cryaerophilus]MCT7484457.1 helix-turn-helix domain-containing protein [Aliarcobacter cryaerophilus]
MNNSNLVEFIEEPEEFYKMISQNVKKLRQKYKYTQLDFSANIGFNSVSFYCDCENNKNGKHFNLLHIVRISKFLDIDINEIIN